jgi:hypothetical protein
MMGGGIFQGPPLLHLKRRPSPPPFINTWENTTQKRPSKKREELHSYLSSLASLVQGGSEEEKEMEKYRNCQLPPFVAEGIPGMSAPSSLVPQRT